MKKLLLIAALMLPMFAHGAMVQIDTDGLSDGQKAQLIQQAEKLRQSNTQPIEPIVSNAEKWTKFAEVFGKTLSTTAKEIGIQVNEFVQTPVGKMTAAIIVYKYVGSELIDLALTIVGAFSLLFAGLWFFRWFKTTLVDEQIEYDLESKNIFGNHPIKRIKRGQLTESDASAIYWGHLILFAAFVLIITLGW